MRFKTLLILPLFVASLQAASVDDLTFALNFESTEYRVSNCLYNASGSLDIPESYNGLPVTSIGSLAFEDCTNLNSITIPGSVTTVGDYAFRNCSGLTNITIGDSVTSIGDEAFRDCTSLSSITIPDSVTSIGNYAFSSCTSLTGITIPDGVTRIEYSTFSGCSSLTSITIPNSVTYIGASAFNRCSGLTNITIGDSVTSIGRRAFESCSSLTTITIPNGVTYIGEYAFWSCSSLTRVTIPDSITTIGQAAFDSNNLSSAFVPDLETNTISVGLEAGSFLSNAMFELIAERLLQDDDFVARLLDLIPQGPAGETGPQGPQGIQGDTGPQGPAGLDSTAIQTLRASEPHVEASQDGTFNVQYRIQSSKDLNNWNEETVINSKMDPHNSSKQFLRLTVE